MYFVYAMLCVRNKEREIYIYIYIFGIYIYIYARLYSIQYFGIFEKADFWQPFVSKMAE